MREHSGTPRSSVKGASGGSETHGEAERGWSGCAAPVTAMTTESVVHDESVVQGVSAVGAERSLPPQQLLAAIVGSSDDAIVSKSLHRIITSWNQGAERLYGYSADEAVGKPITLIIPESRRSEEHHIFESVLRNEPIDHYETDRVRKDGSVVRVSLSIAPIRGDTGEVVGAAAIARDISERKRGERMFRGLLEAAPDAMVIVDGDARITLVNRQAEQLFGYERDELIGEPVELLLPRRLRDRHLGHRSAYFGNPQVRPMGFGRELFGLRRDGIEFPVEISLSPLRTDGGMLVSASIRDITERREAEAMFRGLLEAAPDAMVIVDGVGRITLVNRQAEQLFGYPREQMVDRPVEMLIPERVHSRHLGHRAGYVLDPLVRPMGVNLELYGLRSDGTEVPVEISLSPLETARGVLVSAAIRDITDRKRAEAELEEAHRAVVRGERLSAVGEMATVIGHELRNPLGAATNALYLARYELGQVDGAVDRHLTTAERALAKAAGLSEDLTVYMRERDPQVQTLDFAEVMREVRDMVRTPAGVTLEVAPAPAAVDADPALLVQVLVNLVTNACQAMPDGGRVTVASRAAGDATVIEVCDEGTGLDAAIATHVFEPFYTTKVQGTGLGLAIVQRVVEAHGGRVTLAPAPGGGAVATVRLPRTAPAP